MAEGLPPPAADESDALPTTGPSHSGHCPLMRLPLEIMTHIISYCGDEDWDFEGLDGMGTFFQWFSFWETKDIKALRLTCRSLNEIASPWLLRQLWVQITPESLTRLRQISEKPAISDGVRVLRISVSYPEPELVQEPTRFVMTAGKRLYDMGTGVGEKSKIMREVGNRWIEAALVAEGIVSHREPLHATRLSDLWHLMRQGLTSDEHRMLHKAFQSYRKVYKGYEQARPGFASKVAEAMSRMPRVTSLEITDNYFVYPFTGGTAKPLWGLEDAFQDSVTEALWYEMPVSVEQVVQVGLKFSHKSMRWRRASAGCRSCPVEALFDLPALMAYKGIRLTRLEIILTPPPIWPDRSPLGWPDDTLLDDPVSCGNIDEKMRAMVGGLLRFHFVMRLLGDIGHVIREPYEDSDKCTEGWTDLESVGGLMLPYIQSPVLKNVKFIVNGLTGSPPAWLRMGLVQRIRRMNIKRLDIGYVKLSVDNLRDILCPGPKDVTLKADFGNEAWRLVADVLQGWWQARLQAEVDPMLWVISPSNTMIIVEKQGWRWLMADGQWSKTYVSTPSGAFRLPSYVWSMHPPQGQVEEEEP
ncbi:hypothetical protein LX32DRAFT_691475 [Colletotrichum zoysiae]|uniref:F-box domain-containing protein n=1 Tax=Colletotrichum zoysiae TaxID=1216348 RepID=A0AAD9M7M5_9PEZI|nr:hypothetical protein LX32DRAFT_691475 [Colletotrichum zoysiae]